MVHARSYSKVLLIGSLGSSLGLAACASQPKHDARLTSTLHQLEDSARKERRRVRDLEYEIARLENKLGRTAGEERTEVSALDDDALGAMPELRVEVLDPTPGRAELDAGSASRTVRDGYHVAGVDEEGYEIVYVGDAARDTSVAPDTDDLASEARARAADGRRTRTATRDASDARDETWDLDAERLDVTDTVGPTVERQLAQARELSANRNRAPRPETPVVSPPVPAPVPAPDAAPDAAPDTASDKSDTAEAQYKRYYEALRVGNHAFAIAGFKNFIARYPRHTFADNARYWLAEAYYDKREYAVALDEFRKVPRDYPNGNKVPDAMLKAGFCLIALGDQAGARKALEELVARHPQSTPAAKAKERLETLPGN